MWEVTTSETKLKEEFAELLLRRPHEPMECAKIVSNDDFALSYVRSKAWPTDSYVLSHKKKLLEQFGARYFLPTREEMVHLFWHRVTSGAMEDRDAIAAGKLAGEFAGYIGSRSGESGEGGGNSVNNTVILQFVKPDNNESQSKTIDGNYSVDELEPLNIEFK